LRASTTLVNSNPRINSPPKSAKVRKGTIRSKQDRLFKIKGKKQTTTLYGTMGGINDLRQSADTGKVHTRILSA